MGGRSTESTGRAGRPDGSKGFAGGAARPGRAVRANNGRLFAGCLQWDSVARYRCPAQRNGNLSGQDPSLRILHVNKFLYRRGGAEGYLLDVADLQRQAGHEVELWGMHHPDNLKPQALGKTFPSHVELEPTPGGFAALTAGARMIWSPSSRRGLERALHDFRPDVVHCHNIYHQLSPSILVAVREAGIPCVMTLHDYKLACPSYQMLNKGQLCQLCVTGGTWHAARERCKGGSLAASGLLALESGIHRATHAYAPVDVFVSPSRFLADIMRRSGIASERLRVVSHFVELQDVPQSNGKGGGGFLFAGRLSYEKAIDTLITAVSHLPTPVHLDIAGEGPMRPELERMAAELAPGRVTFHGRLASPQLRNLLARSIASVVPSRWYENQPMTILESFAASVPVIASDLGGMPELVRDEVDGLVVPHDDPSALVAALRRLDGDRALAHNMGLRARARLAEHFSAAAHLRGISEVYDYAAHRSRSAALARQRSQ